ncbi:MAG: glycosyl hydrolase family 57, partial [Phycisphaerae bacterium SG8_4]
EGGSWTNDRSWVRGYEHVLGPMQTASAMFAEKVLGQNVSTSEKRYREALFHLMNAQTSCFRYWGQGTWTDYGRELCRRTTDIIRDNF